MTLLSPSHIPQDSDVFLHWAPVEEAGDPTQILFSKKVGDPTRSSSPLEWKAGSTRKPVSFFAL